MHYKILCTLCCVVLCISCTTNPTEAPPKLTEPFFGLMPSDTPQVLAPGILSTALGEYNGTFSTDGKRFFYTAEVAGKAAIAFTELGADNQWSQPAIAPFSGQYSEYDPLFAPDGKLYFSSQRPVNPSDRRNQSNIWFVEKTGSNWSNPQHVHLSEKGDYYSSLTQDGHIYYNIWETGKILKATLTDSGYVSQELPEIINSRSDAGDPFIAPDESYLIYRAYYREGLGRGDLYISFNINGNWTQPQNLGAPINSNAHEICPYVTPDGKLFIFASDRLASYYSYADLGALQDKYGSFDNGNSNIYYMSAAFIERMRQAFVGGN